MKPKPKCPHCGSEEINELMAEEGLCSKCGEDFDREPVESEDYELKKEDGEEDEDSEEQAEEQGLATEDED